MPSFYDRYGGGLGTNLLALRAQLRRAGVRRVTGRLYEDDSVFDRLRGVADSGYATSPYIGPLSGLSFDSGYRGSISQGFASDPAKLAASKLARALRGGGVSVRSQVARGVTPPGARALASVRSPTMSQIVAATDVYSNNFFAEMLVEAARRPLRRRRHDRGRHRRRRALRPRPRLRRPRGRRLRPDPRQPRLAARTSLDLLQAIRRSAIGEELIGDLAVAGKSGTVDERMHGTAAYGRCHVKTGTLTGVSALSGICENRSGRTMIFSILMNSVSDLTLAHYEQDKIAAAVASY